MFEWVIDLISASLFNLAKNDFPILSNQWEQKSRRALKSCKTSMAPERCYVIGNISVVLELMNSDGRHWSLPLLPRLFRFFIKDTGKYFSELFNQLEVGSVPYTFTRTVGNDPQIIYISAYVCVHKDEMFSINLC